MTFSLLAAFHDKKQNNFRLVFASPTGENDFVVYKVFENAETYTIKFWFNADFSELPRHWTTNIPFVPCKHCIAIARDRLSSLVVEMISELHSQMAIETSASKIGMN